MSQSKFYNAQLGNWKQMSIEALRLKPEITMNENFFSALSIINSCLPYLEEQYFQKDIKLNILYYSHIYGNYPDFQVIGDLLQLNYKPTTKNSSDSDDAEREQGDCSELTCLKSLFKNTIANITFENNFIKANEYFYKYFKFNNKVLKNINEYALQFENKKVLGIHYNSLKESGVAPISVYDFIRIIDDQLLSAEYDTIFIVTKTNEFTDIMKKIYSNNYEILYYNTTFEVNNELMNSNRLTAMKNKINDLKTSKKNRNNQNKIDKIEIDIVNQVHINRKILECDIINSFLLSKCNFVLKTHSQLSAYSKVFNPDLKIYKVNGSQKQEWPECSIPFYDHKNVKTINVKNILKNKLKNELQHKINTELVIVSSSNN